MGRAAAYNGTTDWIDALEEERIGGAFHESRGWQPMDMEMDPTTREATPRSETDHVKLFERYFAVKD